MGASKLVTRDREAWALARQQHGVVTRQDLLGLGFSAKAIRHRLATGRLRPVARGVYTVGWPLTDRKQGWMAAVRICGEGALLSHASAAALWRIGPEGAGPVDVSIRRRCGVSRPGIRARARPRLPERDVTERHGIPVTTPVRTLIDQATELTPNRLERMVNEADKHDVIDPETLREALDDYVGERGVKPLRALLDRLTFRLSDTELEVLFRPIAAQAGLPVPLTKEMVNGFEVDFYWPDLGLVVETDGWRYHRTASAQTRDALRDQIHTASGLTSLRFSHYQVKHEPRHVLRILTRTAANLQWG
ncbi:MAG: type IV toxin-antitoxin system AbiEi family antitoxin domain-containing protein [Solirubrobacterales bacterium]